MESQESVHALSTVRPQEPTELSTGVKGVLDGVNGVTRVCRSGNPGVGRTDGRRRPSEGSRTLFDPGGELLDLVVGPPVVLDLLEDLALGVHDRGVVLSAEGDADLG